MSKPISEVNKLGEIREGLKPDDVCGFLIADYQCKGYYCQMGYQTFRYISSFSEKCTMEDFQNCYFGPKGQDIMQPFERGYYRGK